MLLVVLCLALPPAASGKIYKYVDESGRLVFVDSEHKIPARYRQKVESFEEELDRLTPEERQAVIEERRDEREQEETERRQQKEERRQQKYIESLQTRVEIRGNQVIVPVEVAYGRKKATLSLLLDTGATSTLLHRQAIAAFEFRKVEQTMGQLAGGYLIELEKVRLKYLQVGPFKQPDVTVAVIESRGPESGIDGLLGMDFLKHRHYRIDYTEQLLLWEEQD